MCRFLRMIHLLRLGICFAAFLKLLWTGVVKSRLIFIERKKEILAWRHSTAGDGKDHRKFSLSFGSNFVGFASNFNREQWNQPSPYRNCFENGKLLQILAKKQISRRLENDQFSFIFSFAFFSAITNWILIFFHLSAFDECQVSRTQLLFALNEAFRIDLLCLGIANWSFRGLTLTFEGHCQRAINLQQKICASTQSNGSLTPS